MCCMFGRICQIRQLEIFELFYCEGEGDEKGRRMRRRERMGEKGEGERIGA